MPSSKSKTPSNTTKKFKKKLMKSGKSKPSKSGKSKPSKSGKSKSGKSGKSKSGKSGKSKSGKSKSGKSKSGKKSKNAEIVENDIHEYTSDDASDDNMGDFNVDEEQFFDAQNFKSFNAKIKFHVFDPEHYENEAKKEIIIVPDQYRKTSEVLSQYEMTDVVSNRAKQIENNSPVFVDVGNEDDPIKMAEMEVRMKKCPLSILRMISNNIAEIWAVNDMTILY